MEEKDQPGVAVVARNLFVKLCREVDFQVRKSIMLAVIRHKGQYNAKKCI